MSTVKITDLPEITILNSNTANTVLVGVDLPTNETGKITLTALAKNLYSNNNLVVGNNFTILPNVVGQFTGNSTSYIQVNLENQTSSGSADYVITADDGTDSNYYIDLGLNGSAYSDPAYSSTKAHDGYLYVSSTGTNKGNLSIGTTNSTGKINFVVGGMETANIVGYVDVNGIWSKGIDSVVSANAVSANSVINTRVASNVATLRSEITSNSNTQNIFSQAAFNKANNALANTSGTFAGDLTITGSTQVAALNTANFSVVGTANVSGTLNVVGSVSMNATLVLANSNFSATESAVTISASPTVATPSNDGYMVHISGKNGIPTRIVSDAYGTGAYSVYASRSARGTVASPTAVQSGDIMGRFSASGYGTTKWQQYGTGRIDFVAAENYSDANTGSQIQFWNCPVGSNTLTNILTLNGDSAAFTGVVNPQKGFIYTPRLPAGNQTAITINYATDSIIKANLVADLTVSHSNFTAGKVVEVWLLNSGGTNRTVTHGVSALNSATNSTTFTIPSTSSAYMRYFCIDGDLANTFVSVVHA